MAQEERKTEKILNENICEPETEKICGKKKQDTVVINIPDDTEDEELSNIIKFSKTYEFEGEKISEIDLSEIENVNYIKMQEVEKAYKKLPQTLTIQPESTMEYAMAMAHVLTGLPLEFFKYISGKDLRRIKTRVINFFYGTD